MEQFEQIRRDRDREGLSIRALAKRHGVHRRAVRQALASPLPPAKRAPVGRPAPKLGPYRALIDEWLRADREAPRKQRHTAKRIWRRLVDEHGANVAEVTVRQYMHARKREMGWRSGRCSCRRPMPPGVEAEVDWGQAVVELAGLATTVHLFVMRASFAGAAFCQASLVEHSGGSRSGLGTCRGIAPARAHGGARISSSGRRLPGLPGQLCLPNRHLCSRLAMTRPRPETSGRVAASMPIEHMFVCSVGALPPPLRHRTSRRLVD